MAGFLSPSGGLKCQIHTGAKSMFLFLNFQHSLHKCLNIHSPKANFEVLLFHIEHIFCHIYWDDHEILVWAP